MYTGAPGDATRTLLNDIGECCNNGERSDVGDNPFVALLGILSVDPLCCPPCVGRTRTGVFRGVHEGASLPLTSPMASLVGIAFAFALATPFTPATAFSEGTLDYLTEFPSGSAGVSAPLPLSITITPVNMVGGFFGGHG